MISAPFQFEIEGPGASKFLGCIYLMTFHVSLEQAGFVALS